MVGCVGNVKGSPHPTSLSRYSGALTSEASPSLIWPSNTFILIQSAHFNGIYCIQKSNENITNNLSINMKIFVLIAADATYINLTAAIGIYTLPQVLS